MTDTFANGTSAIDLPNPFTPMAFLPPEMALQATITTFLVACSLGVLIWDILPNLGEEFYLAFKRRLQLSTCVYFLSRVSTLVYLVGINIVQMNLQIENCRAVENALSAFFVISHASTAFLLYFRVCAVYGMKLSVVAFFGISWIGVIIGAATIFWALEGIHIGPTMYCTAMIKHEFIIATSGADLINDTLVFGAIVYKLGFAKIRQGRSATLQGFTRGFLQESQFYYLIAVLTNFLTIIIFFAAKTPSDSLFRIMMIIPNTIILNIMACRVFRNVKFGRHTQVMFNPTNPISTGPLNFNIGEFMGDATKSMEAGLETRSDVSGIFGHSRDHSREKADQFGGIEVTRVVELTRD